MAYSNCTAILAHGFDSCGYRTYWQQYETLSQCLRMFSVRSALYLYLQYHCSHPYKYILPNFNSKCLPCILQRCFRSQSMKMTIIRNVTPCNLLNHLPNDMALCPFPPQLCSVFVQFIVDRTDSSDVYVWRRKLGRPLIDEMERIQNKAVVHYRVIHNSVKHFKNPQQIDYATDHGNSYVDIERNR